MSIYSFLLMLVMCLTWWGCASNQVSRNPAGAGLIGAKGEVVLFYKLGEKIVVKQCEDHTNLQVLRDCKLKTGTRVSQVNVDMFKDSLKQALKMPGSDYDIDTQKKIESYNKGIRDGAKTSIEKLKKQQLDLKPKITDIEDFIKSFGEHNADTELLATLRSKLAHIEEKLEAESGDYSQILKIIKEINGKIDNLVDNVISSPEIFRYTFSEQRAGFIFNILKSYLRTPTIFSSFQKIPKGIFMMGSPSEDNKRERNEKLHRVKISRSFDIMTTEVTQLQWFLVMGYNNSTYSKPGDCEDYMSINGEDICPHNPIEGIRLREINVFIKKLNEGLGKNGCADSTKCYRLPTEAEWEYAARGNTKTIYSFGNRPESLGAYAWFHKNSNGKTHPVGLKRPNPFGLYDMHGNVWERVADNYMHTLKRANDPLVRVSGRDNRYGVSRGGGKQDAAHSLRSARRARDHRRLEHTDLGFRLVRQVRKRSLFDRLFK